MHSSLEESQRGEKQSKEKKRKEIESTNKKNALFSSFYTFIS